MATSAPHVRFTDYHDLSFLAECATALRASVGRPLPSKLTADLTTNVVDGLHAEWIVDMRYRRVGLASTDAWTALNNASWVKTNWLSLT